MLIVNILQLSDRAKSGDFGSEDEEHPGRPKNCEVEELEAILDEDCWQSQKELAAISQQQQPHTFKARKLGAN